MHRDLKPENILLKSKRIDEFDIKLCDFGFSCHFSGDEKADLFIGTPAYIAPEIINKEKYD